MLSSVLMKNRRFLGLSALSAGMFVTLVAAAMPQAMKGAGLWEVSKSAVGHGERICLSDPALLTQWEHRRSQCTRVVVSSTAERAVVQYTCTGGGFGTAKVQVITPRSVRIDLQGINDKYPFGYVLHARRVGNC